MVHLVLSSTKGNQGQRFFPHVGYLGLTPVRVEGIVRTKLDQDSKRLPAKSITISVRCYETRVGRVHPLQSALLVDLTHTLWAKPDGVEYEPIGNLEFPFRLSIPARVAGFSTAVFVDYRCVWRIEAVLHHAPIVGVGARQLRHYELPLVRYDLPPPRAPEPPCEHETTKPRAPRIRYAIHAPQTPVGPHDLVSIPIHLQPLDPAVSIRSASVIVERRIVLHDIPPPPHEPSPEPASSSSTLSLPPTITPGSIFPAVSESAPLLPHAPSAKVIANPIAGVESSGSFCRDPRGTWSKTLTLQWPAPKSHSRWAIGETINSDLVSVKYFVRTKIIVTSPAGTESLELADQELLVVSTNEAERQLALAKYNEMHDAETSAAAATSRSKSKSPRRAARAIDTSAVPLPPPARGSTSAALHAPSPWALPAAHSRPKPPRRPHTSAGPRDRPVDFAGGAYGRREADAAAPPVSAAAAASGSGATSDGAGATNANGKRRAETRLARPDTAGASIVGGRNSTSFWSTVHSNGTGARRGAGKGGGGSKGGMSSSASASTSTSSSASASQSAGSSRGGAGGGGGLRDADSQMREWEEELARIEVRSRRSSDLLGFAGKMKRAVAGIGGGGGGGSARAPVPVPAVGVDM